MNILFSRDNENFNYKNNLEIEDYIPLKNFRNTKIKITKWFNNFFSNLFFIWIIPVLKKAHSKTIKIKDLGKLSSSTSAKTFFNEIMPFWKDNIKKKKKYPLLKSILQSNLFGIISILILAIIKNILNITTVFLFRQILLEFRKKENEKPFFPLKISIILMLITKFIFIFVNRKVSYFIDTQGAKTTIQVNSLMYDKVLKLTNYDKDNFSEGQIINLIEVDSEKFSYFLSAFPNSIFLPFSICFYLYMLFKYFGPSFFFSISALLLVMYISSILQKKKLAYRKDLMFLKDERMKITTEVFNMLKILKVYSWEDEFEKRVLKKREKELEKYSDIEKIALYINTIYWSSTTIISVISIIIYNCIYESMNVSNILTAMYIFNSMSDPLYNVPGFLTGIFDTIVSMKRIEKFLLTRSSDSSQIFHLSEESGKAIKIDSCDFGIKNNSYNGSVENEKDILLLKNISLNIDRGELIGIFGEVGSGKTLLLNAILNNMDILNKHTKGNIKIYGRISYISQNPWILNDTIKNNILFFNEYDEERYKQVIKICELEQDIKIINGGDYAEIGEKGVNLSGGQKARIAIARALYANADIYLFDDPLSAVDAYVGLKLFKNVIQKFLKGKTRILVTHALQYINRMDKVILMKDQKIELFDFVNSLKNSVSFKEFCTNSIYLKARRKNSDDSPLIPVNKNDSKNIEKLKLNDDLDFDELANIIPITGNEKIDYSNDKESIALRINNRNKIIRITKDDASPKLKDGKIKTWVNYFLYIGGVNFLITIILCNILWKICEVGSDYILMGWTSEEKLSNNENNKFLIIYTSVSFLGTFFVFLRGYLSYISVVKYNEKMHDELLHRLIRAPINLFHDTVPRGQILNKLSRDLQKSTKVSWTTNGCFRIIFQLLGCIFVCINYNWYILFIFPPLLFVDYIIMKFYIKGAGDLNKISTTSLPPVISVFSETIPGISTIKAYNYEDKFKEKCYSKLNNYYNTEKYESGGENWFGLILDLISFILLFVILIFADIFRNKITAQTIGLMLSYTMKLIDYLFSLMIRLIKLQKHITSVERCFAYTKIVQEAETEKPLDKQLINFPEKGKIEFINYSTKYRPNTIIVLNDLNFIINPNEKIGVVGRTGSGKSTLTLSLFRIIEPFKGKILIDNIDISQIGLKLLRKSITVIPQEPFLIEGNLRENIDPLGNYTKIEIENVLNSIGLDYLQLNDEIEENGKNLSIGEKQLICIARAILRKSKIIVMDEATSSIDYKTESLIQNVINNMMMKSTVITIAHRIKTVINYDKIMVLNKGNIVEFDNPKKLLENKNGLFYELYQQSMGNSSVK